MTPIYHITHVDNLHRVLEEGELVCDAESARRQLCQQSIAYETLKERRARTQVVCNDGGSVAAGGMLADYVPFYFTNRSPMLFVIHKGGVEGYTGGQTNVVYLVSSVEAVAASGRVWCFTDGHAVEEVSEFYDKVADLERVDWDVIQSWSWKNTLADLDRKRRKQAEFLVHERFPWELVSQIGVINPTMATRVTTMIGRAAHRPQMAIEPNWYYNV